MALLAIRMPTSATRQDVDRGGCEDPSERDPRSTIVPMSKPARIVLKRPGSDRLDNNAPDENRSAASAFVNAYSGKTSASKAEIADRSVPAMTRLLFVILLVFAALLFGATLLVDERAPVQASCIDGC
ncbi:hypothetical protein [Methylobacterium symbioticum]|uniref:Uncharacterized protein n=1 Tax=Methylobacterium symbioticum TaxID=2584084 RepID=A0A509EEP2_9HYPH|nr:hypothetical protein [Methylobacterium symbioticum]VUD72797.1 hypothetical protein MET9862_03401 [Methylobacterium symbioticum]